MIKSIILLVILSIFTNSSIAQNEQKSKGKNPLQLYVGFIYAPSASTIFRDDPIFTASNSLFFTPVLVKGNWSFAPYYNFGSNSSGAFLNYAISDELATYVVLDKAIEENTGSYILGFTTPIIEQYIQGYVEIGHSYGDEPTPFLGLGLYFNILKPIKRKR